MEYIYGATRVTDIRNKTVDQLKSLKEMGLREISLGIESGDDWTLDRVNKGYRAEDIYEQCGKLTGPDFLKRKESIVAALDHEIRHGDMDMLAAILRNKRTL